MDQAFPQLAFNQWLARNLANVVSAFTPASIDEAFLGGSVDHADLERRLHALRYSRPARIHY